jgi:hypothetical protein
MSQLTHSMDGDLEGCCCHYYHWRTAPYALRARVEEKRGVSRNTCVGTETGVYPTQGSGRPGVGMLGTLGTLVLPEKGG